MAHLAKSKLISLINNSQTDNIKISYSDASIAGFPFSWTIKFTSPKITIIDKVISREISSDYLNCVLDYSLDNATLEFGSILHYSTYSDDAPMEYSLQSQDKMHIFVDFVNLFYKVDPSNSAREIIKNIKFSNPSIVGFAGSEEELFNLSRLNMNLASKFIDGAEYISLKLSGDYKSSLSNETHKINNANLFLDTNYIINENNGITNENNNLKFDRKIEIINAKINLDESSCDIKGSVSLSRINMPEGKISVKLVRYDDFVDSLVPEDFIFSRHYIKKIISKAVSVEFGNPITNKVNFDINFSDKGIELGRVNLLDLQAD